VSREQFRLPDLGEGLPDAEIVRWLVEVGDPVTVNQPIVEVETAKALVEVPSPFAGTLAARHADEGETVAVGRPLVSIDTVGDTAAPDPTARPDHSAVPHTVSGPDNAGMPDTGEPDGRTPVLVGYGPRTSAGPPRARARRRSAQTGQTGQTGTGRSILAKPPVRKLARDLGVDLWTLTGTGPHGTISRADVEAARVPAREEPAGRVRRVPVTGVRRATAQAMVTSVASAPQATEFVSVDITETMAARDRLAALPEFAGVKVSALLFVARALLTAIRRHPMINSCWEEPVGEAPAQIVVHDTVNLGIAVASSRGLIVPNIPDAERMGFVALGRALHELTAAARAGKVTPDTLRGGTITITNIGTFGIDTGTPILNPPEAAILALGAIRPMPWVHDGNLAVRTVAQLALTFDHRVIDGELGAKVLADIARMLTDPAVALAWN
jgi:pyruvate dehydrogenase E2 component (dihydrolipoamide acetyltransferase)